MSGLTFAIESHTLTNGLRVRVVERPGLPILSLTLLLPSGVARERRAEAGLAHFTAALLSQGTTTRDALRLFEDVDALGASLGVHADYDFTSIGLSCLTRDREAAVEILADVTQRPLFALEEIERKRNDILSYIERRKDDVTDLVRVRFGEVLYGDHPYRAPRIGYAETVSALGRAEIANFYATQFAPAESILAVSGDVRARELWPLLEQHFGSWRSASLASSELPAIPNGTARRVERIQKDGVTQATLRVGALALERRDPDVIPCTLLNYILGGSGFGSRLMKNLREEKGLTYGAYSSFHTRRQRGYFFAGLQTGLATMNEALREMLHEITRLRDDGVTGEELEWAKRFFTGSLPLSFQTNDQLATHVLEQDLYGLEPEFWLRDLERMQAATLKDVNEAARRYLRPEEFTIVALADFREADLQLP